MSFSLHLGPLRAGQLSGVQPTGSFPLRVCSVCTLSNVRETSRGSKAGWSGSTATGHPTRTLLNAPPAWFPLTARRQPQYSSNRHGRKLVGNGVQLRLEVARIFSRGGPRCIMPFSLAPVPSRFLTAVTLGCLASWQHEHCETLKSSSCILVLLGILGWLSELDPRGLFHRWLLHRCTENLVWSA